MPQGLRRTHRGRRGWVAGGPKPSIGVPLPEHPSEPAPGPGQYDPTEGPSERDRPGPVVGTERRVPKWLPEESEGPGPAAHDLPDVPSGPAFSIGDGWRPLPTDREKEERPGPGDYDPKGPGFGIDAAGAVLIPRDTVPTALGPHGLSVRVLQGEGPGPGPGTYTSGGDKPRGAVIGTQPVKRLEDWVPKDAAEDPGPGNYYVPPKPQGPAVTIAGHCPEPLEATSSRPTVPGPAYYDDKTKMIAHDPSEQGKSLGFKEKERPDKEALDKPGPGRYHREIPPGYGKPAARILGPFGKLLGEEPDETPGPGFYHSPAYMDASCGWDGPSAVIGKLDFYRRGPIFTNDNDPPHATLEKTLEAHPGPGPGHFYRPHEWEDPAAAPHWEDCPPRYKAAPFRVTLPQPKSYAWYKDDPMKDVDIMASFHATRPKPVGVSLTFNPRALVKKTMAPGTTSPEPNQEPDSPELPPKVTELPKFGSDAPSAKLGGGPRRSMDIVVEDDRPFLDTERGHKYMAPKAPAASIGGGVDGGRRRSSGGETEGQRRASADTARRQSADDSPMPQFGTDAQGGAFPKAPRRVSVGSDQEDTRDPGNPDRGQEYLRKHQPAPSMGKPRRPSQPEPADLQRRDSTGGTRRSSGAAGRPPLPPQ